MDINRREFLGNLAFGAGCALGLTALGSPGVLAAPPGRRGDHNGAVPKYREASYYQKLSDGRVQCLLCPVGEKLAENKYSLCRVRFARGGKMYVTNYGQPCAMHLDPVEKDPLYHYYPGMKTLALATAGCNLACPACQNWEMSQKGVGQIKFFNLPPVDAVKYAVKNGCGGFSYTFTEPAVFFEYCRDISKAAAAKGLKNCVVTGGYINPEPLKDLTRCCEAFCVSLKGTDPEMYGGGPRPRVLETIQQTMKIIKEQGKWLEVAILVIPTKNDTEKQIWEMTKWCLDNLGRFTPVHFSRFYPSFQLKNIPQTPVSLLENAQKTAKKLGIAYSYVGNVPGHVGNNTYCHNCNKMLVQRVGFRVLKNLIENGKCKYCGTKIPGYW